MTTDTISYSEVSTFLRCHYKWQLAYPRKIDPIVPPLPMLRGTLVHEAYAVGWLLWAQGSYSEYAHRAAGEAAVRGCKEACAADEELIALAVRLGVHAFKCSSFADWHVVEYEGKPLVERRLFVPLPGGARFSFKPDAVIERLTDGHRVLLDLKTRKSLNGQTYLAHDLQSALYTEALARLGMHVDAAVHLDMWVQEAKPPKMLKSGQPSTAKNQLLSRESVEQCVQDLAAAGTDVPQATVDKLLEIADGRVWHHWVEMRATSNGRTHAWQAMLTVLRERRRYLPLADVDPRMMLAYDDGPLGCRGCSYQKWCDTMIAQGAEPLGLIGVLYDCDDPEVRKQARKQNTKSNAALSDSLDRLFAEGRHKKGNEYE